MTFLYELYDNASEGGFKDFKYGLPEYISSNLRHPLRPYQKEAIGRYLYYKNDEKIECFLNKFCIIWQQVQEKLY